MARVILTPGAQKQFEELPAAIRARILNVFHRLERWPVVSGARRLRGVLGGSHRIRTGDYRVQFRVLDESVLVERVGHRDGFYHE